MNQIDQPFCLFFIPCTWLSFENVRKNRLFLFFCHAIFFSLLCSLSAAQEMDKLLQSGVQDGITVDLREPFYSDGVLSTEKGGVITASQIRIQALHLCYTRKVVEANSVWTIEAAGDLIVEFGDYVFVGEKLFYDFQTKEGMIYKGKTAVEPWYFGGERLELKSDGSYIIYDGYVTTSEKDQPDWGIYAKMVHLEQDRYLKAQQVHLRILNYTVLWIPTLRANLDSVFDNPIRYRFRWGGRQGPRFGLTYEIFSWERWKTFIRFDYRLTRGPGGGIETRYRSLDHKTEFQSINYIAKDSSILHPHEKARYRLEGIFKKQMDNDKTNILLTYDRISDKRMPGYYYDRDFDFDTSQRTQLLIRRQEDDWIGNLYARVRINSFETLMQELPTLEMNLKPFALHRTGIIFENWASASYLNFEYSKFLVHVHDYASGRVEYRPTLYRPFILSHFLTMTPEIGMVTILYSNGPKKEEQWLALGKVGLNLQTQLYRYYGSFKHVIQPYAFYRYYSSPTSSPHQHYIFDLDDGWTRLNYLSFGVNNAFYAKKCNSSVSRIFSADLYTFAFFDTHKIRQTIPRLYACLTIFSLPNLKHILDTAWNLEHQEVDHFNFRTEWTLNADFAIACEYRHRCPYWWRKVDHENFFLDVFRSEKQLRHSLVSDRRDTLLLHFFYRFHPNWAFEFTSRQGWNRQREPSYFEYEIDLLTTIQTAWHLRFSFQHQEIDNRIAVFLNVGLRRPDEPNCQRKVYCYD
jgi:hypothetical protein